EKAGPLLTLGREGDVAATRMTPVEGPLGLAVADEDESLLGPERHSARLLRRVVVFLAAGALRAGRGAAGAGLGSGSDGGAKAFGGGGSAATGRVPSVGLRRKWYRKMRAAPARSTRLTARSGSACLRSPTPLGLATPGAITLKTPYPNPVAAPTTMMTASAIAA